MTVFQTIGGMIALRAIGVLQLEKPRRYDRSKSHGGMTSLRAAGG